MTKYYNAETRNSLEMQFGGLVCKKIVIENGIRIQNKSAPNVSKVCPCKVFDLFNLARSPSRESKKPNNRIEKQPILLWPRRKEALAKIIVIKLKIVIKSAEIPILCKGQAKNGVIFLIMIFSNT